MSTALFPLWKGEIELVFFGAIMLIVAVACYGLVLVNPAFPILNRSGGMRYAGTEG